MHSKAEKYSVLQLSFDCLVLNLRRETINKEQYDIMDLHIVDALQEVGHLTLSSLRVASATIRRESSKLEGFHLSLAKLPILV